MKHRLGADRGAATIEMVILSPLLILFMFLVVLTGRLTDAKSDIVGAANDAARAASLQNTAGAASAQAEAAARDAVAGERIDCVNGPDVSTSFSPGFERGAIVHVQVTCTVDTGDVTSLGIPITVDLHGEAWEPIDAYRSL